MRVRAVASHEHVHLHAARDASAVSATGTALHHVNSAISAVGGPLRRAKETLEGASQRQPHAAGDRQMSSVRDALDAHMRRFRAADYGTPEGARKAAQTRKSSGAKSAANYVPGARSTPRNASKYGAQAKWHERSKT